MAGKRRNRDGKPWQRGDGRWVARVWPPEGSIETRPVYVYGATSDECARKRDKKAAELAAGIVASADAGITIGAYLAAWLSETLDQYVAAGDMADSTADSYRDNARLHIIPYLGHVPLRKLTAPMVRQWQHKLLTKPSGRTPVKTKPGEPAPKPRLLSARTVAYQQAILHKAIEDAIRDEVAGLDRNVLDRVTPARDRARKAKQMIGPGEAAALLVAMSEDELWCYWLGAFALGWRRGEGLGMRWPDLDRETRVWRPAFQVRRVRGEPDAVTGRRSGKLMLVPLKTAASLQPVALPAYFARALDLWEEQQNGVRATAPRWANLGLVFSTRLGTAIEPRNVNRAWAALCARAEVRHIPLHDLRHACATYLLHAGVNLKTVQGTLRHARMATTEIYVHALAEVPREAADAMDAILAGLAPASPGPALRSALRSGDYPGVSDDGHILVSAQVRDLRARRDSNPQPSDP